MKGERYSGCHTDRPRERDAKRYAARTEASYITLYDSTRKMKGAPRRRARRRGRAHGAVGGGVGGGPSAPRAAAGAGRGVGAGTGARCCGCQPTRTLTGDGAKSLRPQQTAVIMLRLKLMLEYYATYTTEFSLRSKTKRLKAVFANGHVSRTSTGCRGIMLFARTQP